MSNIGSFFNLGSQTTFVNQGNSRLRLKINPSQTITDVSFVFPTNEGDASGYVLATDGSGTTSWVAQSGGGSTNPAGPTNAIQFNGGTSDFSGVSNLTFNSSTNILTVNALSNLSNVNVSGLTTLDGLLTVNALSDLSAVDISNTLDVSGATTLDGVLNVNALTFLNNNVDVSGDISCNSRIVLSTLETTVPGEAGLVFRLFNNGINIGDPSCGLIDQSWNNIAIGFGAGYENQSVFNIAIGQEAGKTNQGQISNSNAIGNCIAIGHYAGRTDQNTSAIAIGGLAGYEDQSSNAIAIGESAGQETQSSNSIAIGSGAGYKKLGQKSIAIGYQAEFDNSTNNVTQNVIVLNARESSLNSDVSSALFIKPLRDVSNVSTPLGRTRNDYKIMVYDSSSGEVAFDASYNGTATGGSTNPGGDANAIQFNGGTSDFSGVSNLTFDSTTNILTVNADSSLNNVLIRKGTDASNATLTLDNSSSLVMSPQIYRNVTDFSGIDIQPTSSILIFDYSNNQNIDCSLNNASKTYFQQGQHLSIFYLNRDTTPGNNLRIDFGVDNIVTGSGANRYLTFTTFGQSAELLAYGDNNTNNYLVFNTGASASS